MHPPTIGFRCVNATMNTPLPARKAPLLYTSPIQLPGKPWRGGIPLLFPQFADRGPLRKHGFARDSVFAQSPVADAQNGPVRHHSQLNVQPGDWPGWPYAAHLEWLEYPEINRIRYEFRVTNTGNDAFDWTGGLHPYIQISRLMDIEVEGLSDLPVADKLDHTLQRSPQQQLRFKAAEFERLYVGNPTVVLTDPGLKRQITLRSSGFTEWMVWNPGPLLAQQLADLPEGDWQQFVCIEPVIAHQPTRLAPGETFTGTLDVVVQWM
ncbi:D-hexose-6-phosphate mutarotase [Limnobacter humi]|uniref:D-hexose-6-phosphate mutarotase n=1 Tax=Limnobacter humi TaxID=1778671 RepID=A0ABT1WGZ8_9BURK|nr:D-hexose-6-phosphate mutarotase [Limnobacter humi]MCQ8896794.1 D-hexose-6-phosphate mutarotase [Limnobacter humi]